MRVSQKITFPFTAILKTLTCIPLFVVLSGPVALADPSPDVSIQAADETTELTMYTSRKEHLIKPMIEAYEKQTGTKIKYITGKAPALIKKLQIEKSLSQADLFWTVDVGNLWRADQNHLLQGFSSEIVDKNIPEYLRAPGNNWVGVSVRARAIVYHSDKLKPDELTNYRDLASEKWKGKLCLRTAKKVYNQSLVAMFLNEFKKEEVQSMVSGWVANLAQPVYSSDTDVIKAIEAGKCSVGIVNSYYLAQYKQGKTNSKVNIFFPKAVREADGHKIGTHINVSGIGILASSTKKQAAQEFIEWLSSNSAQQMFAAINYEFPAASGIRSHEMVESWGDYEPYTKNLSYAGIFQNAAIMLMDKAGYH